MAVELARQAVSLDRCIMHHLRRLRAIREQRGGLRGERVPYLRRVPVGAGVDTVPIIRIKSCYYSAVIAALTRQAKNSIMNAVISMKNKKPCRVFSNARRYSFLLIGFSC